MGKIVGALKSQGLYETTNIFITAKHGQSPRDPTLVRAERAHLLGPVSRALLFQVQSRIDAVEEFHQSCTIVVCLAVIAACLRSWSLAWRDHTAVMRVVERLLVRPNHLAQVAHSRAGFSRLQWQRYRPSGPLDAAAANLQVAQRPRHRRSAKGFGPRRVSGHCAEPRGLRAGGINHRRRGFDMAQEPESDVPGAPWHRHRPSATAPRTPLCRPLYVVSPLGKPPRRVVVEDRIRRNLLSFDCCVGSGPFVAGCSQRDCEANL